MGNTPQEQKDNRRKAGIACFGLIPYYNLVFPMDGIIARAAGLCVSIVDTPDENARLAMIRHLRSRDEMAVLASSEPYYLDDAVKLARACILGAQAALNVRTDSAFLGAARYLDEAKSYARSLEQGGKTTLGGITHQLDAPGGGTESECREVVHAMRPDSL